MSCGRIVVLGLAILALAMRLTLREYILERLLPQCTFPKGGDKDGKSVSLPTCTIDSVTTSSYRDLRVAVNDTAADAIAIVRQHGVAFFEDLLTTSQANALRNYILRENSNPTRSDWFVLSSTQRKHLAFGLHEDPAVTEAIHAILTSPRLQGALRGLLGGGETRLDHVALMELASITSFYGAEGQRWHKDTEPSGPEMELFSLFIPLQSTVEAQGPTGLCAGTHKCAGEKLNCDTWSKTTKATTVAGTGALMSSQLFHRGSKHQLEPSAEGETADSTARVMFYMSFSQAPTRRHARDYRFPPKGATYALRPHLWGMTAQQVIDVTSSSSSWFSWWWWPWTLDATWGFVVGDGLFGPKHRGWTQLEMACVHWAGRSDFHGFTPPDVEQMCTHAAMALLVLYTVIAELDFLLLRLRQRRLQNGGGQSQESATSQTPLASKAKLA